MVGAVELTILLVVSLAVVIGLVWVLLRSRYRGLAEQTLAANEATERRLVEINETLSTMRGQLASLERILTQVE
jgi:hypothetical protein